MWRNLYGVLAILCSLPGYALNDQQVRETIEQMIITDQRVRDPQTLDIKALQQADQAHALQLKQIIDDYGVPRYSVLGKKTADDFLTLVLHL